MATLEAEIVAKFDQFNRELSKTNKSIDAVEGNLGGMAVAAAKADKSLAKVNKRAGSSSQIFFQAGQAVSDFAVAGVLGAANNIEFLALQLGASGPLILGITALSVAALLFEEDLKGAFTGSSEELDKLSKKTKELADQLIKIKDGAKITFEGTVDELEADGERIGKIVDALTEKAEALRGAIGTAQTGGARSGGFTTFNALADTEALEQELESVVNVLTRQKAIQESINSSVEEQKVLQTVLADLEGTTLTKKVEEVKQKKEALTLLDRAIATNEKLNQQLEAAKLGETSKLETITLQNAALKDQIKIQRELNATRRALSATGAPASPGVAPFARGDSDLGFQFSDVEGLDAATAELVISDLLDLGEPLELELIDPLKEAKERADELSNSLSNGLGNAISSLAASIRSGGDPFGSLRDSIGAFAVDMGQTLIGFGVSGIALKAFVANPAGAIAAGAGLVALGSALQKSAEKKTDAFVSGGAVTGQVTPVADPRQGRDGRFRRSVEDFPKAYDPMGGQAGFDLSDINWVIEGENIVAVNDKVKNRQNKTRGLSNVSALTVKRTSR